MKSLSSLLAFALLTPAAILVGFGVTAAFSVAVAAGLVAIAVADYSVSGGYASTKTLSYSADLSAERLPLAA
jgi:hypothetical protein